MSNSIRHRTKGATYFFTLRLAQRHDDLLIRKIDHLRNAMRDTLRRYPFKIDAIVVLPNVIHMLWTLPEGDSKYPTRIAMLKSRFSRVMPMPAHQTQTQTPTPTQIKRAEKGIWQRQYWEHEIRDADDLKRHRDMIYLSPVHAGLCPAPQDWPHTSLHRDLALGQPAHEPLGHDGTRQHIMLKTPTAPRVETAH